MECPGGEIVVGSATNQGLAISQRNVIELQIVPADSHTGIEALDRFSVHIYIAKLNSAIRLRLR